MNIIEKILAKASGTRRVEAGDYVTGKIDVAMFHDLTGPLTIKAFTDIGVKRVWDPDKIVVIFDHLVPANTVETAELHKKVREFVNKQGIKNFYDIGRGGVCHQVMVERKHVKPGNLVVGADSHTCTYGAVGAFSTGIGSTDMAAVLATGELWFKVPTVIKVQVEGSFNKYVTSKDLALSIIGRLTSSGASYKGLVFCGETIKNTSVDGRMTLSNMAVEAGAKVGIIPPDETTLRYLNLPNQFDSLLDDENTVYEQVLYIDVNQLKPLVAAPSNVDDVKPVTEVEGTAINQVFIGSCTNGRLEDLRLAAEIMKGKKIHKEVRVIVLPASDQIHQEALKQGLIASFLKAGAIVGNPNCGPCLGGHMGILASDEVCLSTSNRNFVGRMGSPKSKIYLASPATAAASAIAGKIIDPTNVLK